MSSRGERLFQLGLREMQDPALLVDEDGKIAGINAAFERLSGWRERDLVGRTLPQLQVIDDGDGSAGPWSPLSISPTDDASPRRTRRYRRRDGGSFWGEAVCLPLCGDDGAPYGFVQIVHDVSARMRRVHGLTALIAFCAEQVVRDEAGLCRLLDLGCRYFGVELGLLCSPGDEHDRIEAVAGDLDLVVAGQELLGDRRFSSMLPCDHGMAEIEQAGSSAPAHAFYRQTGLETLLACAVRGAERCHGTLYFADRRPRRPLDGQEKLALQFIARWVAAFKDAEAAKTAFKESHRRLEESEERYRVLYEKTPAMLHSIDAEGRLASVSDVWLSTLGYQRHEVIGRPSTDFLTPASKRYAEKVVLPAFRSTGRCDDVEYQFLTKAGDVRDVLLSAIAQNDRAGNFLQSLAILLDVTERKQVERALMEKTAALERSNADLARFAHIASHDLQEPLRRIIAYSEILKEDHGLELSDGAAEVAGVIQSGGRRLRLMINDLLVYVRLSEQLDRIFEPVDMSAVLCHALDDLNDEIDARGVRVDVDHLPLVWGRAPLLKMVFYHLLSNAIKHSDDRAPVIEVSVDEVGDVWQFAVTDQGIGVESRFADRIFEIFERLHPRDEREGSGAGLAICRLIIQRCGGDIWLDRSYENGARFVFTLPKSKPDCAEAASTSPLAPRSEIDLALTSFARPPSRL